MSDSVSGVSAGNSCYAQSVYTLTAGTSYVFDIQGKTNTSAYLDGSDAPFYMFAELETVGTTGSIGLTEAQVWARVSYGM
jgi:hypothetical protein